MLQSPFTATKKPDPAAPPRTLCWLLGKVIEEQVKRGPDYEYYVEDIDTPVSEGLYQLQEDGMVTLGIDGAIAETAEGVDWHAQMCAGPLGETGGPR